MDNKNNVSKSIAKLLKKKGINVKTLFFYKESDNDYTSQVHKSIVARMFNNTFDYIAAPTFNEIKDFFKTNYNIEISAKYDNSCQKYFPYIIKNGIGLYLADANSLCMRMAAKYGVWTEKACYNQIIEYIFNQKLL